MRLVVRVTLNTTHSLVQEPVGCGYLRPHGQGDMRAERQPLLCFGDVDVTRTGCGDWKFRLVLPTAEALKILFHVRMMTRGQSVHDGEAPEDLPLTGSISTL